MPASNRPKEQLLTAKLLLGGEKKAHSYSTDLLPDTSKISIHSHILKKGQKKITYFCLARLAKKEHKPL